MKSNPIKITQEAFVDFLCGRAQVVNPFFDEEPIGASASNYLFEKIIGEQLKIKEHGGRRFLNIGDNGKLVPNISERSILVISEKLNKNFFSKIRVYVSGTGNTTIVHNLDLKDDPIVWIEKHERTDEQHALWGHSDLFPFPEELKPEGQYFLVTE